MTPLAEHDRKFVDQRGLSIASARIRGMRGLYAGRRQLFALLSYDAGIDERFSLVLEQVGGWTKEHRAAIDVLESRSDVVRTDVCYLGA